eukprot:m51a1_g6247 hypothetical protein (502) ;mRNA; f:47416-49149
MPPSILHAFSSAQDSGRAAEKTKEALLVMVQGELTCNAFLTGEIVEFVKQSFVAGTLRGLPLAEFIAGLDRAALRSAIKKLSDEVDKNTDYCPGPMGFDSFLITLVQSTIPIEVAVDCVVSVCRVFTASPLAAPSGTASTQGLSGVCDAFERYAEQVAEIDEAAQQEMVAGCFRELAALLGGFDSLRFLGDVVDVRRAAFIVTHNRAAVLQGVALFISHALRNGYYESCVPHPDAPQQQEGGSGAEWAIRDRLRRLDVRRVVFDLVAKTVMQRDFVALMSKCRCPEVEDCLSNLSILGYAASTWLCNSVSTVVEENALRSLNELECCDQSAQLDRLVAEKLGIRGSDGAAAIESAHIAKCGEIIGTSTQVDLSYATQSLFERIIDLLLPQSLLMREEIKAILAAPAVPSLKSELLEQVILAISNFSETHKAGSLRAFELWSRMANSVEIAALLGGKPCEGLRKCRGEAEKVVFEFLSQLYSNLDHGRLKEFNSLLVTWVSG